jgi:hypothetical protein
MLLSKRRSRERRRQMRRRLRLKLPRMMRMPRYIASPSLAPAAATFCFHSHTSQLIPLQLSVVLVLRPRLNRTDNGQCQLGHRYGGVLCPTVYL